MLRLLPILLVSLLAVSHALPDCNFDTGWCKWRNYRYAMIDFTRQKGATPTDGTGPNGDHTTGKGFYVLMNARNGYRGDDAALVYKGFTGSKCLTFWYHMNGKGVGTLQVWVDNTDVLLLKGSKGNSWRKAQVEITGKNSVIEFYAVRKGKKGDIAIDDITFTDTCGPSPTTNKPKPTTAHPSPPLPSTPPVPGGGCGKGPTSRIVGGIEATPGDWRWQALLQSASTNTQFCGGTLVQKQWVVTAAHCVEGQRPRDIIVRYDGTIFKMGAHYRVAGSESSTANEQKFKLTKIIKHSSYHKPTQMSHDIALLKLERPANLDGYTNLACLPSTDAVVGKLCVITGWGTMKSGGSQPAKLQVARVPVVSQQSCKMAYKDAIHDSMVCAGLKEGGKDSCQGDSGGPMVCKDAVTGLYSLHGVTSWGYGCADPGKYGVYARVTYLADWINNLINSN